MNITRENIGESGAYLKMELNAADYTEAVEKELKNYRKKAQIKGFRPGQVPASIVKKMYGKSILMEEVNKLISENLNKYISDNQLPILGQPIAAREDENVVDFENPGDFVFWFEIGLAPDVKVDLEKIKQKKYSIKVTDAMVDEFIENSRRRYGTVETPETASKEDVLSGEISELEGDQVKEGGISTKTSIAIDKVLKKSQALFIGKKMNEEIEFSLSEAFGNKTDIAAMLHVKTEDLCDLKTKFRFKIDNITHVVPAEVNADLFKRVFPAVEIADENAFREEIRKETAKYYAKDTEKKFTNDVIAYIIDNCDIQMPDDFLKRWILHTDERGGLTAEMVEKEYPTYAKSLKWQVIESKLTKEFDLNVKPEEVKTFYKENVLSQYFPTDTPDEETAKRIDMFVNSMMQNQEEVQRVYEMLLEEKLTRLFIEKTQHEDVEVSMDEFIEILKEQSKTKK